MGGISPPCDSVGVPFTSETGKLQQRIGRHSRLTILNTFGADKDLLKKAENHEQTVESVGSIQSKCENKASLRRRDLLMNEIETSSSRNHTRCNLNHRIDPVDNWGCINTA